MNRSCASRITFFLLWGLFVSVSAWAEVVDRVVAKVNDEIITLYELNETVKPLIQRFQGQSLGPEEKQAILGIKSKILGSMVEDRLLAAEGKRLGIEITDAEVKNEVRSFKRKNGLTDKELEEQLRLQGMTVQQFENKMRRDILNHRLLGFMVQRKVVITEEEMQAYYDGHTAEFSEEKMVTLRIIVLDSPAKAAELVRVLRAGDMKFVDAVERYSQGPGADNGGLMGPVSWKDLGQEWKDVLSTMNPGQVSDHFYVGENVAVIELVEITSGEPRPFDEVRDEIREALYRPRLEARFGEYMEGLKSKAVIEVLL
ncbi:MAG: hypothetical protein EOM25_04585 [Deltaproteobacteria bacterium]|nr:hypothetical protein [Deltaproteobacteria bacterium]